MGKDLKGKELGQGIVQRKNGRYEARFTNRFGKRISFSGYDLKDVKKRYNESFYENEKEINIRENIKLDDWYIRWMNVCKYDVIRPDTKRHYNQIYKKHISPYLGNKYLKDIKQIDIKKRLKELDNKGYGFETKNKVRIILLDILNKAIVNEYLCKNPVKGISVKRDEEKDIKVLSVEEQSIFFDCCKGTFYDNLYVVAVTTGMRIGELAGLKWSDIDWNKKVINVKRTLVYQKYDDDIQKEFHIEQPKTKTSKRSIPINKQCEMALKRQYVQKMVITSKAPKSKTPRDEFKEFLFTTKFNTPLNSQIVCDSIKKIVDEINLTRDTLDEMETFSPHCFRHTFATRCFEAGIQPKTVQSYLGHATLQMTMDLYTKVMPSYMVNEMDKFSELYDNIENENDNITEKHYNESVEKNSKIVTFIGDSLVV